MLLLRLFITAIIKFLSQNQSKKIISINMKSFKIILKWEVDRYVLRSLNRYNCLIHLRSQVAAVDKTLGQMQVVAAHLVLMYHA